jgi:phosphomannomutase
MTLIKSISGFRGTIGAIPGEHLTPLDTVKFTAAFAAFLQHRTNKQNISIVVGILYYSNTSAFISLNFDLPI